MSLTASVLRTIRRHSMVPQGGRVLAALSGGPDSVALVEILRDLARDGELVLAGVAHYNHQLRGRSADEDEAFCRSLAQARSLSFEVGRADVRAIAARQKRSVEDAARTCRYAFLHEAADRLNADVIAVGHSRDDQAETFLLRMLRGAGTRGLGAIRPKAGRVIRPLLEVSRAELRQFAAERGLNFREDETNEDLKIPRNRVRHELLPSLEQAFGGNVAAVLAREALLAQADDDRLESEAIELAASIVLVDTADEPHRIVMDAKALAAAHPALASRVARQALQRMAGGRFIGTAHIAGLLELIATGEPGAALSLPGQQAVHHGDTVSLGPEPARGVARAKHFFRIPLSIPGEVILEPQGLAVSANWADGDVPPPDAEHWTLVRRVNAPLTVRSRRPGDRFQPPGMGGRSRKLQDYLVDRKVARAGRDFVPLVVDREDRIVWVVGHGVSEGFRASEASPGVILLKARRLGGQG